jgi:ubiquinone/menaquinone biosynthesis C-methylase UbiE
MSLYSRRVFPWMLDKAMRVQVLHERRRQTLADASGRILEIGAGTGANFSFYPQSIGAIETVDNNSGMQLRAARSAAAARLSVQTHVLSAERLPFDDESFDTVVSTFTLCSIPDVASAAAEVRRVLKRGGEFLFLEHGLSREPKIARWQQRLDPLQRVIADGCHLSRDMRSLVSGSGLELASCDEGYLPKLPRVMAYLYQGRARKL